MTEPTQSTSGANHPTSDNDFIAPGQTTHIKLSAAPPHQIARLKEYLASAFPREVDQSNRQHPEAAADTAIRLLKGLHAVRPPTQVQRCTAAYCNAPLGHTDQCPQWTNAG